MKNILLIEDNLEMRENTAEILELSGYKVMCTDNGKTGVELAREHKPDLIICDIMMPGLDGYGVLHVLGKSSETAGIPFIFLTAKADKSDIRKGMNLGADDYISKPFDDFELLDAIESRFRKLAILEKKFDATIDGFTRFLHDAQALTDFKELACVKNRRIYKKKEFVYVNGNSPSGIYFLHKGKVKIFRSNEYGKDYIIAMHSDGEFFGYTALLENCPYAESAEAMEDSELYFIHRDEFFTLLYKNRDVANSFIKMLSNNLLETEERLLKLAYNSVRKRVAETLLQLSSRQTGSGDQREASIEIARDDLAGMVGTATESVIRTLSDFKSEKLIAIKGRVITILDPRGLREIA